MGLFGGGNAAKKSSRELRKGINSAQGTMDAAYGTYLDALPGQYASLASILGQGRDATLGAVDQGYNLATGNYDQALKALADAYATARGDVGTARSGALSYYQPYIQAGQPALSRIVALTTPGDTSFQADPGYAWRVAQGEQAIQNSAAGRGGVLGGNTLKALEAYRQGQASNEYNNVYNRNLGLATLGYGASQGAADTERWAGNLNTALASRYGADTSGVYGQLADLASRYGNNRAGILSGYYGTLGDLTSGYNSATNAAALARANATANFAVQNAQASAAREAQGGGGGWLSPVLGLAGGALGGYLGGPSGGALGAGLGSALGGYATGNQHGTQLGGALIGASSALPGDWGKLANLWGNQNAGAGSEPAAGYGIGGNNAWISKNPWLAGAY